MKWETQGATLQGHGLSGEGCSDPLALLALFCLPAKSRCPQLKGVWWPPQGEGPCRAGFGTLKVSTWPSPAKAGDPAQEQGRNCLPTLGSAQVALRSPTMFAALLFQPLHLLLG